jgi:hypothetical protein
MYAVARFSANFSILQFGTTRSVIVFLHIMNMKKRFVESFALVSVYSAAV